MSAPSIVQQTPSSGSPAQVMTFTSAPALGNLIAVMCIYEPPPTSISDNHGNSYTQQAAVTDAGNGNGCYIYTAKVNSTGSGFAVTLGGGNYGYALEISGWNGNASAPYDGTPVAVALSSGGTTLVSVAMNPTTQPTDLLLSIVQTNNNETCTATGGWAILAQGTYACLISQTVSSAGSYTAETTMNSSDLWTIAAIAFGPPSAAGPAAGPMPRSIFVMP